ncbi:Golgi transport complex subunit 7, partial [Rhizoclosmatium hyalinum]
MDAFKSHDLEKVKEYRLVFDQIQRSPEFIAYYFKTAKAPLLSYWKKLNDEIDMEDASGFLKGLQLFFDQFLVVFRQELSWSEHLFSGNSAANMIKLVHQTFNSLKPSVRFSLDRLKNSNQSNFLILLTNSFKVSVSWCISVEHELVPLIAAAAAPKKELSSTPSTAQIVSKKPSSLQIGSSATPAATAVAKVDLSTWAFPILETFSPYHQTYQSLELAHLVSCIPSLFTSSRLVTTSTAAARIAATVDALMDPVIPAVFRTVETSTLRSIDFTAGFG